MNHKRVERIWRREGLKVPAKQPKRGRLWFNDGTGVRLLTVIDEYSGECLAIRAARSIRSADVIEVLAELMVLRGVPDYIRSDNGPEFTARAVRKWLGTGGRQDASTSSLGRRGRTACEFQREVEGRAAGQRGLPYVAGGACADGALQADVRPDQTAQLSGLPAAGA